MVLLISTAGLRIDLHFCGGALYDIGVFTDAKSCCEELAHNHCKIPCSDANQCSDNQVVIQLDEDFIQTAFAINFSNNYFELATIVQENFEILDENLLFSSGDLSIKRKLPPEKSGERLSHFQSFII